MQMLKKLILPLFCLLFLSPSLAVEVEQLAMPRNNNSWWVNYALPGWVEIDSKSPNESTIPTTGAISLYLPSDFYINRAGETYQNLSVGYDGRILLGNPHDIALLPELGTGIVPHVIPTFSAILPVTGSTNIPLKWFYDRSSDNLYTIIQVGPFMVSGSEKTYSYQVLVYADGEIQVMFWRHDGNTFLNKYESVSFETEKTVLGETAFYNGIEVIHTSPKTIYDVSTMSTVVANGVLRAGWVAKSFNGNGVIFRTVKVDATQGLNGIKIQFGTGDNMPGGLFAYDHSREHPVVGSFRRVKIETVPTEHNTPSILSWYFTETLAGSAGAGYPTVDPLVADSSISDECLLPATSEANTSILLPCMYKLSWSIAKNAEWISAPAVKFQSSSGNRELIIKNIYYQHRQPQSVQFRSPKVYSLKFNLSAGGYVKVDGKAPATEYTFPSDRIAQASINANPGQIINSITINGYEVFKNGTLYRCVASGDIKGYYAATLSLTEDGKFESIKFSSILDKDYIIDVKFSDCAERLFALISPSYVKSEKFLDAPGAGAQRKMETYSIQDGFGRVVETQQKLDETNYAVQGTYLDAFGRTYIAPLSFVRSASDFSYVDLSCYQCVVQANVYYDGTDLVEKPDDKGFPYLETRYHDADGTGAIQSAAGLAGASFALSDITSKNWSLPASGPEDFLSTENLNDYAIETAYQNRFTEALAQNGTEYILNIKRDAQGHYAQSISDGVGNILATWTHDGVQELKSAQDYDEIGRPTISYPAGREMSDLAETIEKDGSGRTKSITGPDRGKIETQYDQYGRVKFTRDARQLAKGPNYFSANEYDALGRLVRVGEVRGGHSFTAPDVTIPSGVFFPITETVYGPIDETKLVSLGMSVDASVFDDIASQKNVQHNDIGAVISYAEDGSVTTLKAWSYDRLGNKLFQWIVYGIGSPPVRLSYVYNDAGELSQSNFSAWNGSTWEQHSLRNREYDSNGRLIKVLEDGQPVVTYNRSLRGLLASKTLYDKGTEVINRKVVKDIAGRSLSLTHSNGSTTLYNQEIEYADAASVRIAQAKNTWSVNNSVQSKNTTYAYDDLGRLTEATGDYGGSYAFDNAGRLSEKAENGNSLVLGYTHSYHPGWVSGLDVSTVLWLHDYDAVGNLVIDRYNGATFKVGSQGLPVDVRVYGKSDMPSLDVNDVATGTVYNGEKTRIEMAYDESGTRVWRKVTDKASGNIRIEATMPGVGTYVQDNGGIWTLARLELVEGGYRPDATGDALFAVNDAQGSVRGYAQKGSGLVSAYAYSPYGTLHELKESNATDRSRWQGKEYDGEYGKYYFGSRYFDPMFGIWASPDPARQFANPYTYGGDPLNFVDPNGEEIFVAAIIIGAVVGATAGAYQCGHSDQSCAQTMTVGAAVGAVSGQLGGFLGAAAGFGATGSAGLAAVGTTSNAGATAAVAGGVAEGAVNGAIAGTMSSSVNNAISRGSNWWRFDKSFGDDLTAGLKGGVMGGVMGGLSAGLQYGFSDAYKYQTYKKVYDYGITRGRELDIARYATNQWGGDVSSVYTTEAQYVKGSDGQLGEALTFGEEKYYGGLNEHNALPYRKGDILVAKSAFSDASNLYETVGHEVGHQTMGPAGFSLNREHLLIYKSLKQSPSAQYWSDDVRNKLQHNLDKTMANCYGNPTDLLGICY